MPADRDLDNVLDEALASYSHAEPDPSLRARIITRAETHRPRRILWPAAVALAAAALFVLFLLHPTATTPKHEPPVPRIASAPPPAIAPPAPTRVATHPHAATAKRRNLTATRAVAHRDVFPTPAPLTAQESALLQFATQHPEQARQVLAASSAGLVESAPLKIEPIRIAALSEPQPPKSLVP
jgi:hypothetical protein